MYQGIIPEVVYQVVTYGVFFGILEFLKTRFTVKTASQIWMASFCSGLINIFITSPLSVIASSVISHNKNNLKPISMYGAVQQILKDNGPIGLYKGFLFS